MLIIYGMANENAIQARKCICQGFPGEQLLMLQHFADLCIELERQSF